MAFFQIVSSFNLNKLMVVPKITVSETLNKNKGKNEDIDWVSIAPMETKKVGNTANINDLQIISSNMQ